MTEGRDEVDGELIVVPRRRHDHEFGRGVEATSVVGGFGNKVGVDADRRDHDDRLTARSVTDRRYRLGAEKGRTGTQWWHRIEALSADQGGFVQQHRTQPTFASQTVEWVERCSRRPV